jgi:hypothetical protein
MATFSGHALASRCTVDTIVRAADDIRSGSEAARVRHGGEGAQRQFAGGKCAA